ncbi:MAG: DUF2784 domain-containing protein [Bacteroidales bacterium]|jgi:hypothetical protein|nr:DUF2784 domain-containing protein [Bacteroidales bacterium]
MNFWYHSGDVFFVIFHSAFLVFILTGWIFKTLRPSHLIALIFTALSWFFLGIWFGWGYCFLTDWHWIILDHLGKTDIPASYIQYLILRITGFNTGAQLADIITAGGFLIAIILSVILNFRDYRQKRKINNTIRF